MQLPGGVVRDGTRRRDFAFKPADGALEAALAETAAEPGVPAAVTAVLAAALAELAGTLPDRVATRRLSVGDRQFLMRRLSVHLGHDSVWLTAVCRDCGERFDFEVRQSDLPVKDAGGSYPFAVARSLRMRVPTGEDQEAIAGLPDAEAAAVLFGRCRLEGEPVDDTERAAAEAAVEAASPEVALAVATACPACGTAHEVALDPYLELAAHGTRVFEEVHRLASAYHWSEREILGLPRARRHLYLQLLDRSRGFTQ